MTILCACGCGRPKTERSAKWASQDCRRNASKLKKSRRQEASGLCTYGSCPNPPSPGTKRCERHAYSLNTARWKPLALAACGGKCYRCGKTCEVSSAVISKEGRPGARMSTTDLYRLIATEGAGECKAVCFPMCLPASVECGRCGRTGTPEGFGILENARGSWTGKWNRRCPECRDEIWRIAEEREAADLRRQKEFKENLSAGRCGCGAERRVGEMCGYCAARQSVVAGGRDGCFLCPKCCEWHPANRFGTKGRCVCDCHDCVNIVRRKNLADGICPICAKQPVVEGRPACEACIAYRSKYYTERGKSRSIEKTRIQRRRVHEAYGGSKCGCCGCETFAFLTIDHIDGVKQAGAPRSGDELLYWLEKNGFPDGYRVLCRSCNMSFGRYGYCPCSGGAPTDKKSRMVAAFAVAVRDARLAFGVSQSALEREIDVTGLSAIERGAVRPTLKTIRLLSDRLGVVVPEGWPETWPNTRPEGPSGARLEAIAAYGGKCLCCGESAPEKLEFDHIGRWSAESGGGVKMNGDRLIGWLKRNGWPKDGHRLLCANCNHASYAYKACPCGCAPDGTDLERAIDHMSNQWNGLPENCGEVVKTLMGAGLIPAGSVSETVEAMARAPSSPPPLSVESLLPALPAGTQLQLDLGGFHNLAR